jgi:hypothetical protein
MAVRASTPRSKSSFRALALPPPPSLGIPITCSVHSPAGTPPAHVSRTLPRRPSPPLPTPIRHSGDLPGNQDFHSSFPFLIQDISSAAWPRDSESPFLVRGISSAVSASPPDHRSPLSSFLPQPAPWPHAFRIRIQDIALAVGALTRHSHSGARNTRTLFAPLGPRNASALRNPDTGCGPGVCSHRSPAATQHTTPGHRGRAADPHSRVHFLGAHPRPPAAVPARIPTIQ